MKKFSAIICIFILLVFLFSCNKNNNPVVTGGTITANINGTPFVSASVTEVANPSSNSSSVKFTNVFTATDSSKTRQIILYIDSLDMAVYSYDSANANAIQYNTGSLSYGTYSNSKGSIIINSNGTPANTVSGTFSGVGHLTGVRADSVKITNGVFTNCAY